MAPVLRNKGALLPGGPVQKIVKGVEQLAKSQGSTRQKKKNGGSRPKRGKNNRKKGLLGSTSLVAQNGLARSITLSNKSRREAIACTPPCMEFMADLASSTAGAFTTLIDLPINPGDSRMFKRLVANADIYEQWRFKYLRFHYEPSVDFTTPGVIGMYVDHDAVDAASTSMANVMAHADATMGPIYTPLVLDVGKAGITDWYFTNQGYVNSATANDRFQTPGDFRVFCDKVAAGTALGYLYVEYQIEFRYPKDPASLALGYTGIDASGVTVHTGNYLYFAMDFTNNGRVNRGFTWEDQADSSDVLPFTSSGVTYWPCTSGSALYSVNFGGTMTVTNGSTYSVVVEGVPPNSATRVNYFTVALTGTGAAQNLQTAHCGGFTNTIPSGTRLYVGIQNTSGDDITVTSSGFTFFATANIESNVSSPARLSEEKESHVSPPVTSSFFVPQQNALLMDYLGSCGDAAVLVTPIPPSRSSSFLDELMALEEKVRSLRSVLPPSSLPSSLLPSHFSRGEVLPPSRVGDETGSSSRPPSAFSVLSKR